MIDNVFYATNLPTFKSIHKITSINFHLYINIYIYIYVCVCV